jgi:carbon-monoxide dehydrogenase medium subunit
MKPAPFDYHAPTSLEEVLDLLTEHGDEAKLLAGGQSLIPMLSMRLARPAQLIDLNGVADLAYISDSASNSADLLTIGATTRERAAERSALVSSRAPVLAQALPWVGHEAIRNRGTIGGSVAHADASAELPAVMAIAEATMVAQSSSGRRAIPAESFFLGHYSTALADDECLVEIQIPATAPDAGWSVEEVARRHGDFALVGVAAMVALRDEVTIRESRLCIFGVAGTPLRVPSVEAALAGASVSDETFASAAAEATGNLEPASDVHGSGAFRRRLAEVTVRKALATATRRANAG